MRCVLMSGCSVVRADVASRRRRGQSYSSGTALVGSSLCRYAIRGPLGGLLANVHGQAIVKAKDNENIHGSLFSRTRATMFFGTPHRGMLVDDILAMIGQSSQRMPLVRSLESGSPVLRRELESFVNYSAIIKSKIITFKEMEQTRRLMKECRAPTCRLRQVGLIIP